jgi:hypothetical protein
MGTHKKLFIGIPVYGGINTFFFESLIQFVTSKRDLDYQLEFVFGDSLVSRARNTLTMRFLKSDCTHMLQIDSDLVFSAQHIERIVGHDEAIVGGFYPKKKQGDIEWVFNCLTPPGEMDSRDLTPVKYIGTGFLCVARSVFEKMISELGDEIVFKVDIEEKVGFDFWPVGVYKFDDGSRRYLSEDWYFCQRALDLGFKIFGDNRIALKHCDTMTIYPLKSQENNIFGKSLKTESEPVAAAVVPTDAVTV